MALIIRWSTKEVTKRPFKIVCTFSYSEGMNCCYLLLWRWINKSHLWLVHLFLKLDFLDLTLICWREDTLGMRMLVLSWIPVWQKRRGALELLLPLLTFFYSLPSDMFFFYKLRHWNSRKWLSSEVCTFIKLILEGRLSKRHQTSQAKASCSEQLFFFPPSLHINFCYFINSC